MNQTAPEVDLQIEIIPLKKAALILRAINHQLRQELMQLIHRNPGITVTEIYIILQLEQAVASQQLAILRRAGIVNTKREGRLMRYFVSYEQLENVQLQVKGLIG